MLDIESNELGFNAFLDLTLHLNHKNGVKIESLYHPLKKSLVDKPDHANLSAKGGILADEMGLGKTILMLGAIVCNYKSHTTTREKTCQYSFQKCLLKILPKHFKRIYNSQPDHRWRRQ